MQTRRIIILRELVLYFTSSKSASWISSLPFCCAPAWAPCCAPAPCAKSCAPGWVSAFPLFFRDVYKKERKAALCKCKVMAFLYGGQYLNVGVFCVFVVYVCVYASFSSDSRELK